MNISNATGIVFNNVSFNYAEDSAVLKNLSLQIKPGTFLGIIGSNGSGKSTFLHLLNGLIPHLYSGVLTGEILVDGIATRKKNVAFFAKKIGMLFQNPDFSLFNLTVKEEIEFGLKNLKITFDSKQIAASLAAVNLTGYEMCDPQTLSFGQKQKVCLAALLAMATNYLVLDEPIAMLDYQSSVEIYRILVNLNQQGKTIIVVEHDADFLWQYAKEILVLDKGMIVGYDQKDKILTDQKLLTRLGLKIPHYTYSL